MNKPSRVLRISARLYQWLLRAYPAAFRREYGEPMAQLFRDCSARAFAERGYWGLVRLWRHTLADLVSSSLREHVARLKSRARILLVASPSLTPRARRSLEIAVRAAETAGCMGIGLEHVLLGLIEEGAGNRIGRDTGVAGYVLRGLNVNARRVREQAVPYQPPASQAAIDSTSFVPILIRSAEAEARRLGHSFVGTEHLLLGLIGEQRPALETYFQSLGVSVEQVQQGTLDVIAAPSR
jgi:hypothetical protein